MILATRITMGVQKWTPFPSPSSRADAAVGLARRSASSWNGDSPWIGRYRPAATVGVQFV